MEAPYGSKWSTEEKVKRREMVAAEARYIFLHGNSKESVIEASNISETNRDERGPLVGFVHYRFTSEEEVPVLYVYELQLEPCVRGKGLGKFLMQLIELIACKVIWSSAPSL